MRVSLCRAICFGLLVCSAVAAAPASRTPVIIDTDVGTDIDDAFALGLALGSCELDLRGVTVVGDDQRKRGLMACRFLTSTGRRNIRVAVGADPQPARPITNQHQYYHHPAAIFNRTSQPEQQPAADFLYSRVKQQSGQVTLLCLGPLTNVARLLDRHADAGKLVGRIIALESNLPLDVVAARKVLGSSAPLVVVSNDACQELWLNSAELRRVFSPGTPLTRQVEALFQMWDSERPPLGESLAIALAFNERLATIGARPSDVDQQGRLVTGKRDIRYVRDVDVAAFRNWYVERMESLVSPADRPARVIQDDKLPHRVHVVEDFETDIERQWWMSGKPEMTLLPPGSTRACRGVLTHDFDAKLMISQHMPLAVVFNPVPGPPMGPRTRLRFRYWLKGTDRIRAQIYSLTNGYHRQMVVDKLPQESWQTATIDLTQARRPDGTGGPLGEGERIDDIQFYVDPDSELIIDEIVLYEAGADDEARPFPQRIVFAGWFDTGKQGDHWPGDFELVADAGNFWRAVKSVHNTEGMPWIRIGLRGERRLGKQTHVAFRHQLRGADKLRVVLRNSKTGQTASALLGEVSQNDWAQSTAVIDASKLPVADEVQFVLSDGAELLVDDLMIYEP